MTDRTNPESRHKKEAPIDGSLFGTTPSPVAGLTSSGLATGGLDAGTVARRRPRGVAFGRHYTREGVNPLDAVEWT